MNIKLAQFFKEASDYCGNQECKIHEDYSGRGMFGRSTVGIVLNNPNVLTTDVLQFLSEEAQHDMDHLCDLSEIDFTGALRSDNMGLQTILY